MATHATPLRLTSPAFRQGEPIPRVYTADGRDVSPPLQWFDPPPGTRSFALICDDPDAPSGTFTHWIVYGLASTARELKAGESTGPANPDAFKQGLNDFDRAEYDGPAPPPGKPHHYVFRLFALDAVPDLPPGASRRELEAAMQGHVLGVARLVCVYLATSETGRLVHRADESAEDRHAR